MSLRPTLGTDCTKNGKPSSDGERTGLASEQQSPSCYRLCPTRMPDAGVSAGTAPKIAQETGGMCWLIGQL